MPRVLIYTTPTCGFCKMAKALFQEHNVEYEERDVAANNAWADEMIQKSGQMGVPVIIVSGNGKEEMIIGFDKPKLEKALGVGTDH